MFIKFPDFHISWWLKDGILMVKIILSKNGYHEVLYKSNGDDNRYILNIHE